MQLAATETTGVNSHLCNNISVTLLSFFSFSLSIMAPRPFALVRWVEDPEPSCWQVIKTTQITSDHDNIVEGKAVDAIWKKGEETAVAEIIKLGGK